VTSLFGFDSVTLDRDGARVLDDLTVTVPDQGVTAVIGASGSGKSTLLRCCNLLESPSRGRVLFRDVELASLEPRAHRRRAAMVFQHPAVFAGSALDNLRAAEPTLTAADARSALERVGLAAELLDREADTLSGGEAQRLCLARALATRPEAVLADEVTSALDRASALVLERLARALAADGVPVVWVTHDHDQVRRVADYVIELEHGRLAFAGASDERPGEDGERTDR